MFRCRVLACALAPLVSALGGCASLPTDFERVASHAFGETRDTRLGRELVPLVADHPGMAGFHPLTSGTDALVARVALIRAAERSVDAQYYIWHDDTAGRILAHELLAAADRGVRVRLLVDDLDTSGKEFGMRALDAHPRVEIRLFNPFANRAARIFDFLTDLRRVNRRMHNKSLTADNQATIVGGRNVGNEYFGGESEAEFADLDVLAIGTVVGEVSAAFDTYWNSEWVIPLSAFETEEAIPETGLAQARERLIAFIDEARTSPYAQALAGTDLARLSRIGEVAFSWGRATVLYDAPSKAGGTEVSPATHVGPRLRSALDRVTDELIIVSPYFVPGEKLVDYLGQLVSRGVRVRILTNSLAASDVGVVHAGYMRYRPGLLRRGVELCEFKPTAVRAASGRSGHRKWFGSNRASLHAKTFAGDRRIVFVGSFNLDPRSAALNTEMGVLFESPELGGALGAGLDRNLRNDAYCLELAPPAAGNASGPGDAGALRWVTVEDGREVRFDAEPETSWWQRFSTQLLSIFVIESML